MCGVALRFCSKKRGRRRTGDRSSSSSGMRKGFLHNTRQSEKDCRVNCQNKIGNDKGCKVEFLYEVKDCSLINHGGPQLLKHQIGKWFFTEWYLLEFRMVL
ncbi:hypothetical protein K2173_009049 [Erythroxylum novogranatense]|uniref:Apple domain-containing protein n=1 Tax=Erythroxylum novogranatense TaxID=1862640 RepID=A0AAV8TST1_9ROSI|nr:hypothetical protein K2173_009049 [Erythroxylum novogranatense]